VTLTTAEAGGNRTRRADDAGPVGVDDRDARQTACTSLAKQAFAG
jgi:hypothetical protein